MQPSSRDIPAACGAVASHGQQEPHSLGRVLVVEDARCIQRIVVLLLRRMNLDSETADNGRIACDKAMRSINEHAPYDLILMDIQMPQMNGFAAAQWLREHGWDGPILALTALSTDEQRQSSLNAGCSGHISKPVTEDNLREAISPYLGISEPTEDALP